jgi:murein DD-endopeptidase MepM/ murein hydrolase activator NlpD
MRGKHYTVMIIPHTRARFTKFKVSAAFVLAISLIASAAIVSTGLLPLYFAGSREKTAEIAALQEENRELRVAGMELDQALVSLREQVGYFENEATKFALMAGVDDLPSAEPVGGVREGSVAAGGRAPGAISSNRLRDDMTTLQERAGVLMQSYNALDKVYHDQSLLLASTPSIAPVPGMISYGFQWRRDPFTGRRDFHHGLDLVAMIGTPVVAPADGIVIRARRESGYGNAVYISHGNGLTTRYGHLRDYTVRPGQKVLRGERIGHVGNTGRSLGYHLHYEVLVQGTKVDPMNYILNLDHVS